MTPPRINNPQHENKYSTSYQIFIQFSALHKESILLLSSVISVATFQFQLQTFWIKLESTYESNNKSKRRKHWYSV